MTTTPPTSRELSAQTLVAAVVAVCVSLCAAASATGQAQNPVYVDTSAGSEDTFIRVPELIASGNLAEASRSLQRLLDEEPDRVAVSPQDPDLFVSVREAVHRLLLSDARLLDTYRRMESARAEAWLERGMAGPATLVRLETSRLLTEPGLEAAVRVATDRYRSAQFHAAARTLASIEAHPDLAGDRLRKVTALAGELERLAPTPDTRALADRLRRRAGVGLGVGNDPVSPPELLSRAITTPLAPGVDADITGLLSNPTWTVSIDARSAARAPLDHGDGIPPFAQSLRVLPSVSGDTVYVNDGAVIKAMDRFTLSTKWRFDPGRTPEAGPINSGAGFMPRRSADIEEPSTVTVHPPLALALTGIARDGRRPGDGRLHALDAETGRRLWSTTVENTHEALKGASPRGRVAASEGVAVVGLRKYNQSRRTLSVYLTGLDLATGEHVWTRLVGSVGALPYIRQFRVTDASVVHRGVVYRPDRLGVVGAYEAATGRPIWVRRVGARTWNTAGGSEPWEMSTPVIAGDSLVVLTPDRLAVLALDLRTGAVRGRTELLELLQSEGKYLVRAPGATADAQGWSDGAVCVVGAGRIAALPADTLDARSAVVSEPFEAPGVRGRVVASGRSVLAPTISGVAMFDFGAARDLGSDVAAGDVVALNDSGNVIALPSQVLSVDDARVHSYLLWDVARDILRARLDEETTDPMPAITFAELAFRAGRFEEIEPAVERAAELMGVADAARGALFGAIVTMLEPIVLRAEQARNPRAPIDQRPVIDDPALRDALAARLSQIADSPDQRATANLMAGALAESMGDATRALARYQGVLDDTDAARANVHWLGQSAPAGEESARRIALALRDGGEVARQAYERRASEAAQLVAAEAGDDPARWRRVAERFPLSVQAPRAWKRVAELAEAQDDEPAWWAATERGLAAALEVGQTDPAVLAPLAGDALRALESRGQTQSAARLARRLAAVNPDLELSAGGTIASAARALDARASDVARWPLVGEVDADVKPQVIGGWEIMWPARVRSSDPMHVGALVLNSRREVALWAPMEGSDGPFNIIWRRSKREDPIDLLINDAHGAYFMVSTAQGPKIERAASRPGSPNWTSPVFGTLFEPDERTSRRLPTPLGIAPTFEMPSGRVVRFADLMYVADERTFVFAERTGRVAAFDAYDGRVLWSRKLPIDRVHAVDLEGDVLALGGARELLGAGGAVTALSPSVLFVDPRSGRVASRSEPDTGPLEWVRVGLGITAAGGERAIAGLDPETGRQHWTSTALNVQGSKEAWMADNRLFVLGGNHRLFAIELLTPDQRQPREPRTVNIRRDQVDMAQGVRGVTLASGRFALANRSGAVAIDETLRPIGEGSLTGFSRVLHPEPAGDRMVTLETSRSRELDDGAYLYELHALDPDDARVLSSTPVLLGASPRRMALMDGWIALTAGDTTVLIPAPAE